MSKYLSNTLLIVFSICISITSYAQCPEFTAYELVNSSCSQGTSDIFISEYIEGSSSNKCVEIFNGTSLAINFSLVNYRIRFYANGSTTPTGVVNLSGTVASNDVYVVCESNADPVFQAVSDQNFVGGFNGDDAVVLEDPSGIPVDIVGQIGCDPGVQWTDGVSNNTQNNTLVRNPNVTSGISTNPITTCGPASFPTLFSEWTSLGNDNASDLGQHTFNGTPTPSCCQVCKNDSICIAISGVDLPVGGTIDFYASSNPGFNPYVEQSNPLGGVVITSPLGGPILPPNNPQVNFPNTTLIGAMINACGIEGENEFVFLNSGATGTTVSNFQVVYNSSNTVRGCPPLPGNTIDIYTAGNTTVNPALIAGLNANAGCALFQAAPAVIPPNSIFAVFSNGLNPANYDFTAYCGITIYVLFGNGWNAAGNFSNANGATRDFCVDHGGTTDVYSYTNQSVTIDGTYANWDMPSTVDSDVPPAPDCGVGLVFPEIADPLVFCFTFDNTFCTGGPVYVAGIINPHPDQANPTTDQGTACEITNTNSTTEEYAFCVNCVTPIFSVSSVNCAGGSDGSITVTPTGGTPPYSYQWSPGGATTPTITGLTAGTYTVTITDDAGCPEVAPIILNEINPLITGVFNSGNVSCFGASDGFINAQAQGGTSPYNYLWNNGAITPSLNNLPPGTYTLTVTDAAGCTATTSTTLSQPPALSVTASANSGASCANSSDGSATATGSGGIPPLSYEWDNGEMTATATGLSQGTHTVTVTDDGGCTATASVAIIAPSQLTVALGNGGAVCFGASDGFITATPNGGTPGYVYVWSTTPPQTGQTATGLAPGNYGVTVTDANGCTVSASADVLQAPEIVVTTSQVDLVCNGASNGSITANSVVGFPFVTYQFVWSNGTIANAVNTSTINNLTAGTYTVTVTDAILGACSRIISVTIVEPPAFDATISAATNVSCGGSSDGTITVAATGGTPGYTYVWNNGGTTPTISGLSGGTYTVTVTDMNSCTTTATSTITEPQTLFTLMSATTPISCNSASDGVVSVQANGGIPTYNYIWSNGQTIPSISNLGPGTYFVTVTDNTGCTDTNSISISEPLPFTAMVIDSANTSCTACIGTADLDITNGNAPFTIIWSGGQTIEDPTTLCAGINTVTVTDTNGCTTTASVSIGSSSTLGIDGITINNTISCNGVCDGAATVVGSGGQIPYGYQWSNGATTASISGLCVGNYGITLTDVNGCIFTDVLVMNEPTALSINVQSNGAASCGASDGSATATGSGGTVPYSYNWDNTETTPTATGLSAGTHTVTVTDDNGCAATTSVIIPGGISNVMAMVVDSTNTSCTACIGTADLSVSNGTAPFTYIWSGGQTIEDPTTLCAGFNTVTITDANGCTATAGVNINSSSTLAIDVITINNMISCNGVCDGAATVVGTGGQPPYGYQWSNGATTASISGLCAGNYGITLTDVNGCLFTDVLVMNEPTALSINVQSNGAASCGASDGSATATGSGGTVPYSYNWDNTETTPTATSLSAGTHTVTVTDDNGCAATTSVIIPGGVSNVMAMIVDSTNTSCTPCTGTADLSVTNGTAPFTYIWSGGQTIEDPTTLCAGVNTVTITDANGCTATAGVNIGSDCCTLAITSLTIDNPISCNSVCDGALTVTATGGTLPYTYQWSTGVTSSTVTGLCAGTYSVTVDDSNGCTSTGTITLNQPNVIIATATVTGTPTCNGGTDGSAAVVASGGTSPYTYIWSNGSTVTTATGLGSGNHIVTITDNNNCQVTTSVVINPTAPVVILSQSSTNTSCNGICDGTATVSGTGGSSPYSYQWDALAGNQNTPTATGLCAGVYAVTISDNNGCSVTSSIAISEPTLLSVTIFSTTDVSCFGQSDGSAVLVVTGGSPSYSIVWSANTNGQSGPTAVNLTAGGYTATVTDNSGCTASISVTINQPAAFSASATGGALTCFGDTNGSITLTVSGGTAPFNFLWSGGLPPVQNPNGVGAGNYTVTVVDDNGCTTTSSATLSSPTQILSTTTSSAVLCGGSCDGTASILVTGGSIPYSYQWSPSAGGQVTPTVINVCSGTHIVTVTDNNGCSIIELITVGQPALFIASTATINDATCFGSFDGSATVTTQGGTTPYNYLWDNNETTATATGLNGGVHTVTVTDDNGCTLTAATVVGQPSAIVVQINSTAITCNGASDGQATATAFGGTTPFTYNWSTGASGPTVVLLPSGTHIVTVTDGNGCMAIDSVTLTAPAPITTTITSQDATCSGAIDGSATVVPIGGVAPFSYLWDNGEVTNPAIQLPAGTHTVIITDANGCTATAQAIIGSPDALTVGAVTSTPTCNSFNDGTATATASGGTAPYIYTWSTVPPQIGQVATGLTGGVIVLNVVDANGCQITNVNVTVDDAPDAIGLSVTGLDASCNNGNDGSLTVTASGGTPSYTYLWSNGATGPTAFGLVAGGYAVTVTDANGCTEVAIATVDQPTQIQATINIEDAICFGEQNGVISVVDTLITGGVGPYSYSIDGLNYQLGNAFGGLASGNYTFYVQDANGCVFTQPAYVAEPAEVEVDLGPDLEISLGESATIVAQTAPLGIGLTYQWSPPEYLDSTMGPQVISTPQETITYTVVVTDTLAGCTATDEIQISVDKSRDVFIPNVFTPNGDNINDLFMIYGGPAVSIIRTFNVYDRWGEVVFTVNNFEPNDPTNGWDGQFKDLRMNGGVFVYYAEVEFIDGEVIEYKGDVTLIR